MSEISDNLADAAVEYQISILRVEAGLRAKVVEKLQDLEIDLVSTLAKNKGLAPGKKQLIEDTIEALHGQTQGIYDQIKTITAGDLEKVAQATTKKTTSDLRSQIGGVAVGPMKLSAAQLTEIVRGPAIEGNTLDAWWQGQSEAVQMKLTGAVQQGMLLGEGIDDIARRIRGTKARNFEDGIMAVSRREAEAITRTAVQGIANRAKLKSLEESSAVVKGIEWVSTLDSRTTPTCRALDGLQWRLPDYEPVGHDKAFPGPIAHWGCRSTQIAVTRSWAELAGKPVPGPDKATFEEAFKANLESQGFSEADIKTAVANQRASMDGTVSAGLDFDAWARKKGDDYIRGLLGPGRFALWKANKLKMRDLVDQKGRELTIAQLEAAIENGGLPAETEGVEFVPFTPPAKPTAAPPTIAILDTAALAATKAVALKPEAPGPIKPKDGANHLSDYVKTSAGLNQWLNGVDGPETPKTPQQIAYLTAWKEGVEKAIDAAGTATKGWRKVYRYVSHDPQADFVQQGFLSTTTSEAKAKEFSKGGGGKILTIYLPPGTKYLSVDDTPYAVGEKEILFKPGMKMVKASDDGLTWLAISDDADPAAIASVYTAAPSPTPVPGTATAAQPDLPPDFVPKFTVQKIAVGDIETRIKIEKEFNAGTFEDDDPMAAAAFSGAIFDEGSLIILRDADGKLAAALSYSDAIGDNGTITIEHLASFQKGGGSEAVRVFLEDIAIPQGKGVNLYSMPNAVGFYKKIGFQQVTDSETGGIFKASPEQQAAILAKLTKAAPGGTADTVNQAEAAAKIADVIANPKGKTLLAKALTTLQKSEPNLPPAEMLAKAEGIAQEKQAAATKAAALSQAKKKIVEGGTPTPAQQAIILNLTPEETEAFYASVQDAKAAGEGPVLESLITKINAIELDGDKPDLAAAPEWSKLTGANLEAAQKTLADKQAAWDAKTKADLLAEIQDSYDLGETIGFTVEANAKLAKLSTEDQNEVVAKLVETKTKSDIDGIAYSALKTGEDPDKAIKKIQAVGGALLPDYAQSAIDEVVNFKAKIAGKDVLEGLAKQPGIQGKIASDYLALKNKGETTASYQEIIALVQADTALEAKLNLVDAVADGPDVTKLKQAAFKSLTGVDPAKDKAAALAYLKALPTNDTQALDLFNKVEAIASLDTIALQNWKQAVDDAKAAAKSTEPGLKIVPEPKALDATKGLKALDKLPKLEDGQYADYWWGDDDLTDDTVTTPIAFIEPYDPDAEKSQDFSVKKEDEMAKTAHAVIELSVDQILTYQPNISKATVANYLKSGTLASTNPAHQGKPPFAVKINGKYILQDGNHRVSAWILAGETKIPVLVYDLDNPDPKKSVPATAAPAVPPAPAAVAAPPKLTTLPPNEDGVPSVEQVNAFNKFIASDAAFQNTDKAMAVEAKKISTALNLSSDGVHYTTDPNTGEITGAINYDVDSQDSFEVVIQSFGSVAPGSGAKEALMLKAIEAGDQDSLLISAAVPPEDVAFFQAVGFKTLEGTTITAQGDTFMVLDDTKTAKKLLKTRILAAAEAPPVPAPEPEPTPAKVKKAAVKATGTKTVAQPDIDAKNLDLYVPDPGTLKIIKTLSGSTRPTLRLDESTGKQWVVKSPDQGGGGPGHLQSEATADAVYRLMGARVPGSKFIEAGGQAYKVSEYLEDAQTLGSWEKGKTAAQKEKVYAQLREHFVLDALMGNWDVAGQSNDNIMVTADGRAVRIDNGGSLSYRAMGSKKTADEYGPEVLELKTLRQKGKAAGRTAEIFAKVTDDDIYDQIERILERRDDIIATVKASEGAAVAKQVEDRIAWLSTQLPATRQPAAKDVRKAAGRKVAENGLDLAAVAEEARKARINGTSMPIGTTDIEDMQALVWQERTRAGEPETVVHFKLTTEGFKKLEAAIPDSIKKSTPVTAARSVSTNVHPKDQGYAQYAVNMAKTLATHFGDKAYNQGTVASFLSKKAEIEASLAAAKKAKDKAETEMFTHYLGIYDKVEAAYKTQGMPEKIPTAGWFYDEKRYKKAEPKKTAPPATAAITGTKAKTFVARETTFSRGYAEQNGGIAHQVDVQSDVYNLTFTDDGTRVQVVGRADAATERSGLALEGQVEIRIPGEATEDQIRKALEKLETLGVDTATASADYREWVWLLKTANVHNDLKSAKWLNQVQSEADITKRIQKAREFIESEYGAKVPKRGEPGYTADGQANSFGDGYAHVYRADLTPERAEKEMKDYVLIHRTSRSVAQALDAMLESGGEATPTVDRLRKGVNISATGGMSPDADLRTGGASFFFTRIRKKTTTSTGINFKIRNLARADAITYRGDRFGRLSAKDERVSTVAGYKEIASKGGSDETIFKRGLFLLDEIDSIAAGSAAARQEVLDVFKKHGIDRLPDGRKVSDIVTIK